MPATVLRNIPNDFAAAHQAEITNFGYAPAAKIAFQSRRFWEQDHNIYGGISWTTQDITQIWYPNNGFGQDNGVIVGSYIFGGTRGNDFANQALQTRIDTTVTQANVLHPEFGAETMHGFSVAWPKVPFQLGAWGISDPGILLTPDENIIFAGEHLRHPAGLAGRRDPFRVSRDRPRRRKRYALRGYSDPDKLRNIGLQ